VPRPGWTAARLLMTVVALLVYGIVIAELLGGIWLCTVNFPGVGLLPGLLLICFAIGFWPRAPRLPKHLVAVGPATAPELHALIERVAKEIGAPLPDGVYLDDTRFAAESGVTGLLRRRYLILGLRLWNALSPGQRVVLLGHELAHWVNGDPSRSWLAGSALDAVERLNAVLTPGPARMFRAAHDTRILEASAGTGWTGIKQNGAMVWVAELIWGALSSVLRALLLPVRIALIALPRGDSQQAEYFADRLAVRAGGSVVAKQYLDVQLLAGPVLVALRTKAREKVPVSAWPRRTAEALVECWNQLPRRRQLSVRRETSLFVGHPPLGLRRAMLDTGPSPDTEPAILIAEDSRTTMDKELSKHTERAGRELARSTT
jgi:heat shock protein HtpX